MAQSPGSPSFGKRLLRWLLISVGIYLAAIMLLGSSGGQGFFSPDTLEYRTHSEILLLGTQIPLYRGSFEYHESVLVKFLIDKGYWNARSVDSPRWLILFHWNHSWRDGESTFHRLFNWKKDDWIEWTAKHPDDAARFWPRILELLRSGNDESACEMLHETLTQYYRQEDDRVRPRPNNQAPA